LFMSATKKPGKTDPGFGDRWGPLLMLTSILWPELLQAIHQRQKYKMEILGY
jgi:hypothetical protein